MHVALVYSGSPLLIFFLCPVFIVKHLIAKFTVFLHVPLLCITSGNFENGTQLLYMKFDSTTYMLDKLLWKC